MHLDDAASASLKQVLMSQLESLCDADPTVLADYVIALLKHEKPITELKSLCVSQLDDFLKEETQPFVTKLFDLLAEQGHLGPLHDDHAGQLAGDHVTDSFADASTLQKRTFEEEQSDDDDNDRNFKHTRRGDGHIERTRDRGDVNSHPVGTAKDASVTTSDHKRRRTEDAVSSEDGGIHRSKVARGWNDDGQRRSDHEREPRDMRYPQRYPPMPGQPIPGHGRWEGNQSWNGMPLVPGFGHERDARYNDRGNPRFRPRLHDRPRGALGSGRGGFHNGRGKRCRDYEERGFCIRGDACPFDHGLDRIVVDEIPIIPGRPSFDMLPAGPPGPMSGMRPSYNPPFNGMGRSYDPGHYDASASGPLLNAPEAYDPERASFAPSTRGDIPPVRSTPGSPPGHGLRGSSPFVAVSASRGDGRGGRGFGRRGGGRGGFTGHQQRGDTLVVQNIPREFCSIDKVNEYFKTFGSITHIKVDAPLSKAVVQFARHQEALAAYRSPAPIFDNRFVKVFWLNSDSANGSIKPSGSDSVPSWSVHGHSESSPSVDESKAKAAAIDEKKEKARHLLEMQRKQQELIAKSLDEQKKMMERLKDKSITAEEKRALIDESSRLSKTLESLMQTASTGVSVAAKGLSSRVTQEDRERARLDRELDALNHNKFPSGSSTPDSKLVAQLEALKAKASEQGIDPSAVIAAGNSEAGASWGYSRGRGRGAWSSRGRGTGRFSLDNRPKKILIEGLVPEAQNALKAELEKVGPVAGIEFLDDKRKAVVELPSRREAEKVMAHSLMIPDCANLKLSWHVDSNSTMTGGDDGTQTETAPPSDAQHQWEDFDDEDDDNERSWKRR